jgi:thioesterase domain-containing protein
VHPVGGSALCYLELARSLPAGCPVYGLQARGQSPGEKPIETIEEMAALYLEAVRSVQPVGPYMMGGWSLGGLVAFEMARRLLEQGEEVGLLAIFDTRPPLLIQEGTAGPSAPDVDEYLDAGEADVLAGMVGYSIPVTAEELQPLETEQRLELLIERAAEEQLLPAGIGMPEVRRYFELNRAGRRAARLYRSEPVAVRV